MTLFLLAESTSKVVLTVTRGHQSIDWKDIQAGILSAPVILDCRRVVDSREPGIDEPNLTHLYAQQ